MTPFKFTLSALLVGALATAGLAQRDTAPPLRLSGPPAAAAATPGPTPRAAKHFKHITEDVSLDEAPGLLARLAAGEDANGDAAANATSARASAVRSPSTFPEVARATDALGMTHVTYQQLFKGIPVDNRRYVAHARDGRIETVSGAAATIPAALDVRPTLSAADALAGALTRLNVSEPMWGSANAPHDYVKPAGELVVFAHPQTGAAMLTYKFDIYGARPLYRAWVYVDARTGDIVFENSQIHHADEPIEAESLYDGTVEVLASRDDSGVYKLEQTTTGGGIFTFSLNNAILNEDTAAYANATSVTDAELPFSSDSASVSAHYGTEQTYDFYFESFGRRSYDGEDAPLYSYTHANVNYVNAFWDGSRMTYGDGDGVRFGPLTSLDVIGHELTHGVTQYAAGLVYAYESGALNESFSDIFGEEVEYYAKGEVDWLTGADFSKEPGGAFRSMSDPNAFGDPDTYLGELWYLNVGDNGGVHINSGVQNKWFYLLVEGGTGEDDFGNAYAVEGIGHAAAAAIAYRNLSVYLGPFSEYYDARDGANQAAADLFGADSPEARACAAAWEAVGVMGDTPNLSCVESPERVVLTVVTDERAEQTSWQITGSSDFPIFSGRNLRASTTYVDTLPLSPGEYTFRILDAAGDGFCCARGEGSYTFTTLGGEVLAAGSEFAVSESVKLCVAGEPDTLRPSTPENFASTGSTSRTVSFSWDPATDDYGVAGYALFYQGRVLATTKNTSIRFNVPSDFELTLGLVAYDAALNTSGYLEATGTSLPAALATGRITTATGSQTAYICPDPRDTTPIAVRVGYEISLGSVAYVVTDEDFSIVGATGDANVSLAGAPAGTYYVFAFNYTGTPTLQLGDNVYSTRLSDDTYLISQNAVRVVSTETNGGTVATANGGTRAYACLGDDVADFVGFTSTGASDAAFAYVITDAENRILALNTDGFQDFAGAGVGECRVWGLSYTGTVIAAPGDDAAAVALTDGCFDLSDNFITVVRDSVDGGVVSSTGGGTQVAADATNSVVPLATTSASSAPYAYFLLDAAGVIVDLTLDAEFDLAGRPDGQYYAYGVSHTGGVLLDVGDNFYGAPVADGCFQQSANAVVVTLSGAASFEARVVVERTLRLSVSERAGAAAYAGPASVRVRDAFGNVVYADEAVDATRLARLEFEMPDARAGVHFVTLTRGGATATRPVVLP